MPSTGFYLFLHSDRGSSHRSWNRCQCPQRASTYFFVETSHPTNTHYVSMPSTGFYLFLPKKEFENKDFSYVSMPSTGFYLFLQGRYVCTKRFNSVSMPSTGFYLFLLTRKQMVQKMGRNALCQCPQRASTYFFCQISSLKSLKIPVCQCPQRASTYFFIVTTEYDIKSRVKC